MTKEIDTLIPDIYSLLAKGGGKIKEEDLKVFVDAVVHAITEAVEVENNLEPRAELRLSKTGTGLRKVWFEHNLKFEKTKEVDPSVVGPNLMRFLTGHITEAALLLLAKTAGHTVEHEQKEVMLEGIPGHLDSVIDGHTVDIKTASQFSYAKFETGDIVWGKDPFGYVAQLSSYKKALENEGIQTKDTSYFWAYNKSNSDMVLTPVDKNHLVDSEKKLRDQKETLAAPEPPSEFCYPEEEFGKSGNMVINKNCSFCPFKEICFKDANDGKGLRKFKYSKGIEYLTKVVDKPKVEEVT